MYIKLNKYWDEMKHIAAISLTFDPQCKLELIEFLLLDGQDSDRVADSLNQI
jgi:hypothetical protein